MNDQAEEIKISCPRCGQQYTVDASMVGSSVGCQQCGKDFAIEAPTPMVEPGPQAVPDLQSDTVVDPDVASGPDIGFSPESDGESAPSSDISTDASPQTKDAQGPSFAERMKAAVARTGERAVPILVRLADRLRGLVRRAGCRLQTVFDSPAKKKRGMAVAGVLLVVLVFGGCGDKGVVLPLDGIAESVRSTASEPMPRVNGELLEFPGRLLVGSFEIPLEKQSRRISFDFRSAGTTGVERGYTSINLFTCETADAVFITIKDDGIFVQSRRDDSDKAVKVAESASKWKHVEAVMKSGKVVVSVAGKKVAFPAMNGVRWASLCFSVGKPNLQVKNLKSYPEKGHLEMAEMYLDGIGDVMARNTDIGVRKVLKAAKNGLADAQVVYFRFAEGGLVDLSKEEANRWVLKAAKQGDRTALREAGLAVMKSRRTEKDIKTAYGWFSKAADSKDGVACLWCGFLLLNSDAIPCDLKKARTYLHVALLEEEQLSSSDKKMLYNLLDQLNQIDR